MSLMTKTTSIWLFFPSSSFFLFHFLFQSASLAVSLAPYGMLLPRHTYASTHIQDSIIALLLFRDIERLRLLFYFISFVEKEIVAGAGYFACLLPNKLESICIHLNLAIQYKLSHTVIIIS